MFLVHRLAIDTSVLYMGWPLEHAILSFTRLSPHIIYALLLLNVFR